MGDRFRLHGGQFVAHQDVIQFSSLTMFPVILWEQRSLGTAYPGERLAFMLGDTRAPVLLTQPSLLRSLPAHAASVLCLDPACRAVAAERDDNPPGRARADSLAYVICTSGSTGRPTGGQEPPLLDLVRPVPDQPRGSPHPPAAPAPGGAGPAGGAARKKLG